MPPEGTTVCEGCGNQLDIRDVMNVSSDEIAEGCDFTCAHCGRLIAQLWFCKSCEKVILNDLTVHYTRPGWCNGCQAHVKCSHKKSFS